MAEKTKIGKEIINPFYYLGEEHNKGVEYVGGKLDIKNLTIEKLMDEVSNYIITICPDKKGFAETSIYKTIGSQVWNRLEKKGDDFLPDTASYLQKQFYQEYNKITCCAGEMFLENLIDFEKRVLISELPENEQEIFLVAISVGLASYKYWNYQVENYNTSIWKKFITIEELTKRKNNVGGKDRSGAAIGFLIGAIVGNPGLGALIGGVAASIGALVNESLEN